ncbi:MAG: ribonuclease HII [Thermodesulfovibrionia bacterium]|nr:ribonuclease HII [Thermodesulfovibrionia bacterium]
MAPGKHLNTLFFYDETIRSTYPVIAGIDEAGRGPLAGPVVAATVILPKGLIIKGLKDSKKVLEKKRKKLFWDIVYGAENIGIGIVDADSIDRTNILKATRLAMERAVKDLARIPDILLIDALTLPNLNKISQKPIIKGDSISASIAAASIIAKTVRDDIMLVYHEKYPLYNFKKHKGYSTQEHIECIRLYGPCLIHRKSFKKVMDRELPLKE